MNTCQLFQEFRICGQFYSHTTLLHEITENLKETIEFTRDSTTQHSLHDRLPVASDPPGQKISRMKKRRMPTCLPNLKPVPSTTFVQYFPITNYRLHSCSLNNFRPLEVFKISSKNNKPTNKHEICYNFPVLTGLPSMEVPRKSNGLTGLMVQIGRGGLS